MMKKKVIPSFIVIISLLLVVCGFVANSSATEPGGYSHLTDNNEIDIAGYFKYENVSMQLHEESLDFVMKSTEATITFDKPLSSDNFKLYFSGVSQNTLKKIDVELTDAEHSEQCVAFSFSLMSEDSTAVKQINSKSSVIVNGGLNAENMTDFCISYDNKAHSFGDGDTYNLPVRNNQDGTPFSGFSSRKVMMTIRLYGESGSIFRMRQINNQRMGSFYVLADTESPNVIVTNTMTKAMLHSVITVPKAYAMDVLANHAVATVRVTDAEGNEVKATDGTLLSNVAADKEYQIKIEQYGRYLVTYQATDGTNTSLPYQMMIAVEDNQRPEISFKEQIPSLVKVGETLVLPEVTYSDNASEGDKIEKWVTVKYPNGVIMETDKKVEFLEEGLYEITFSSTDEAGNLSRISVKTFAEEGGNEDEK